VTITSEITDDDSGVDRATLYYWLDHGTLHHERMSHTGDSYYATVGPFSEAGTLRYYIKAWDEAGNMRKSSTYTVTVNDCPVSPPAIERIVSVTDNYAIKSPLDILKVFKTIMPFTNYPIIDYEISMQIKNPSSVKEAYVVIFGEASSRGPLTQVLCNQKLKHSYRCKNATFEQRQGQLESYAILDLQLHACKGAQLCEP